MQHWNRWCRSCGIPDPGGSENSARLSPGWGELALIVLLWAGDWSGYLQRSFPTNISMIWTWPGEVLQDKPHAAACSLECKIWGQTELVNLAVLFCWKKKGGKKQQIFSFLKVEWLFVQKCLLLSGLSRSNWIAVLKAETAFKTKYVIQSKIKWEERGVVERKCFCGNWFNFFSIFFSSVSKLENQLLTQLSQTPWLVWSLVFSLSTSLRASSNQDTNVGMVRAEYTFPLTLLAAFWLCFAFPYTIFYHPHSQIPVLRFTRKSIMFSSRRKDMATFCLFMPSKNMEEISAPDPVSQWQIRWETTQSPEEHKSHRGWWCRRSELSHTSC